MNDPKMEIVLTAKDMTAQAFRQVEGYTASLSKQIFSLNGAITTLAGAAGMGYLANQSLAMTAEMKKNATMAGVSAKAYQELTFAASKYQVTQDALMDGMKELSLRADEFVVTGVGPAQEAFERLGYSQAELNEKMKDTPALLLDIIDRMQGLGDAAKIRIADEIFGGTGGEQFVSMINAGSSAVEAFMKTANDLGLVMSDETAAGAVDAYNSIQTLTKQIQTQFNTVIAELAPDLGSMAEYMGEWVTANKAFLTQDIPGHIRGMADEIKKFTGSKEFELISEYWELAAGAAIGFRVGAVGGLPAAGIGALLGAGAGGFLSVYRDMAALNEEQVSQVEKLTKEYENLGKTLEQISTGKGATDPNRQARAIADIEARRKEIESEIEAIKGAAQAADDYAGAADKGTEAMKKSTDVTRVFTGAMDDVTKAAAALCQISCEQPLAAINEGVEHDNFGL